MDKLPMKDWINLGKTLKQLRKTIMEINCNPDLQKRMTKKDMSGLDKMQTGLMAFTSRAEEVMYREYKDEFIDRRWMDIFYGGVDDL